LDFVEPQKGDEPNHSQCSPSFWMQFADTLVAAMSTAMVIWAFIFDRDADVPSRRRLLL
jgi:hypothetical protein